MLAELLAGWPVGIVLEDRGWRGDWEVRQYEPMIGAVWISFCVVLVKSVGESRRFDILRYDVDAPADQSCISNQSDLGQG